MTRVQIRGSPDSIHQYGLCLLALNAGGHESVDSTQILDGIHHHARAHGDQQNILRHAYEAVPGRRRSEVHQNIRGQIVEDDLPGQGPMYHPSLGMAPRHASVALFDQPRRALSAAILIRIVAIDVRAVVPGEKSPLVPVAMAVLMRRA